MKAYTLWTLYSTVHIEIFIALHIPTLSPHLRLPLSIDPYLEPFSLPQNKAKENMVNGTLCRNLCRRKSRLQHICHGQTYMPEPPLAFSRVDFIPHVRDLDHLCFPPLPLSAPHKRKHHEKESQFPFFSPTTMLSLTSTVPVFTETC